jgi:hypothetical protein
VRRNELYCQYNIICRTLTSIQPGRNGHAIIIEHQSQESWADQTQNPSSDVIVIQTQPLLPSSLWHSQNSQQAGSSNILAEKVIEDKTPVPTDQLQMQSPPNAENGTEDPVATVGCHTEPEATDAIQHPISASPQHIDSVLKEQGRELHELLLLFKKANADHISSFNLQTPEDDKSLQKTQRKSSRLSDTKENSKRKTILNKAQKLVAKKWGVVEEDQDLNDLTLQQYLDMYKKTLTEESMEAVLKLTEVAKEKKNKKKDSKRKISESSDKLEAKITGKKRDKKGKKDSVATALLVV